MNNELIIRNGKEKHKVFLKDGFFTPADSPVHIHKHSYAEIHIVTGGNALFNISDKQYYSEQGNLFIIPAGKYHCCLEMDEGTHHTAFQIECDIKEFSAHQLSHTTAFEFLKEIELCKASQDYTKLSAYIILFFSYFQNESVSVQSITDYGYLINEFFSDHYSEDLRLSDLAKSLHLSERQTERLVIEHTGNTFKEELVTIRLTIANRLLKKTKMPLSEIAGYVGYRSYAGFWKAMKKQNKDEAK